MNFIIANLHIIVANVASSSPQVKGILVVAGLSLVAAGADAVYHMVKTKKNKEVAA